MIRLCLLRTALATSDRLRLLAVYSLLGALYLPCAASLYADDPPYLPFNNTGDLFVLDTGCHCIVRITPEGEISVHLTLEQIQSVTGESSARDTFEHNGIAFDAEGAMYFSEHWSGAVLKQPTDGTLQILTTYQQLKAAQGVSEACLDSLVFGSDGMLYAIDAENESILRIDPQSGTPSVLVTRKDLDPQGLSPAISGQVDLEQGLVADREGQLVRVFRERP